MALKNIQVGDNLSGKKIIIDIASAGWIFEVDMGSAYIVTTELEGNGIYFSEEIKSSSIREYTISVHYNFEGQVISEALCTAQYNITYGTYTITTHHTSYDLPGDFDIAYEVDTSHPAYSYIKIQEENVYASDNAKCEYETYPAEVIDAKIKAITKETANNVAGTIADDCILKANIQQRISIVSSIGTINMTYPDGFAQSNTNVLAIQYSPSGDNYRTIMGGSDTGIQVALSSSNIIVTNNILSSGKIKLLLMKY